MRTILFRKGTLITKYSKKKICTTTDSKIQGCEGFKAKGSEDPYAQRFTASGKNEKTPSFPTGFSCLYATARLTA